MVLSMRMLYYVTFLHDIYFKFSRGVTVVEIKPRPHSMTAENDLHLTCNGKHVMIRLVILL